MKNQQNRRKNVQWLQHTVKTLRDHPGLLVVILFVTSFPLKALAGDNTWLGVTSNWNTASNWSTGSVPDAADNVIIPALGGSVVYNPVLTANATCRQIKSMAAGGSISGAYTLTISNTTSIAAINGTATISCNIAMPASAEIYNAYDLTISGVISGASTYLAKYSNGVLTLTGANTYTGETWASAGTLSFNTIQNVSGGASALGAPTTTAKGTIHIGEYGIAGILQYTGSGHSSNRVIKLEVTGATVDASGSGTLTFSGGVTGSADNLILTGTGSAVQSGVIATTSGTVTKNGTGTWTLSGANTYTGTTTVNAGVLNIQHATALGTSAAGTTVNTGAALEIQGGITVTAETLTLNGTGISSGGALRNISGSNVWQTSVTLGSAVRIQSDAGSLTFNTAANSITATNQNLSLGGAGTGTVSGTITTGSGSLTKDGSGTWTLAGANTFTGGVNLNAGTLNINHATALGTVAGTFVIADGTTINNTSAGSVTISANNPMTWNGNFTFTGTQSLNLGTGNVAMGSSLRTVAVSASTLTVGGTISGTGGLTKEGAGALTLGSVAANNWTGTTTINGGTLTTGTQNGSDYYKSESWIINSGATLVSGSNNIIVNTAIITVNTGGTWNTNSRQETVAYIAGGGNITNMSYAGTAIQLDLGTAGSGSNFSGVIAGTGNLVLRGDNSGGTTSTQVLSGANSYSGSTTINGGILNIRHATALGTSAAGTTVASGAALEIQGGITVSAEALTLNGTGISSGGTLRNISGTNVWQSTVTLGSAVRINSDAGTLTFNTAGNSITATNQNLSLGGSGNGTVSGTITTGSGTFTKDGSGTWTLSGANTFTGGSTLNAGTLNINNASALGTVAGTFTINGGAIDNTSAGNITTANYPLAINGDFSYTGSVPGILV